MGSSFAGKRRGEEAPWMSLGREVRPPNGNAANPPDPASKEGPATPTTVSVPRPSRCLVVFVPPDRLPVRLSTDTYRRSPRIVGTGSR